MTPNDKPDAVETDREMIADMLDEYATALRDEGLDQFGRFAHGAISHQASLLRAAIAAHAAAGGEILARGWLHRRGPGDDYDLHDEASGAGKDCPECVPCVIVRADTRPPATVDAVDRLVQNIRQLSREWKMSEPSDTPLQKLQRHGYASMLDSALLNYDSAIINAAALTGERNG